MSLDNKLHLRNSFFSGHLNRYIHLTTIQKLQNQSKKKNAPIFDVLCILFQFEPNEYLNFQLRMKTSNI